MRKSFAVLFLGVGVLIGYAVRPVPAGAQAEFAPFTIGQSVRLTVHDFPSGLSMITCRVATAANEFIGCSAEDNRRPPRWINLRYVQEITPVPEQ